MLQFILALLYWSFLREEFYLLFTISSESAQWQACSRYAINRIFKKIRIGNSKKSETGSSPIGNSSILCRHHCISALWEEGFDELIKSSLLFLECSHHSGAPCPLRQKLFAVLAGKTQNVYGTLQQPPSVLRTRRRRCGEANPGAWACASEDRVLRGMVALTLCHAARQLPSDRGGHVLLNNCEPAQIKILLPESSNDTGRARLQERPWPWALRHLNDASRKALAPPMESAGTRTHSNMMWQNLGSSPFL